MEIQNAKREAYTPNKELSMMFIKIINEHFSSNPNEHLFNQVNKYLTSHSGITALNLLTGYEIVSAAAMFKTLRMIDSKELTWKFLHHPLTLEELC